MNPSTADSSRAAPQKIGAADLLVRLILFVAFLSLLVLAACSPVGVSQTPAPSSSPAISIPVTPTQTIAPATPTESAPTPTAFPTPRTDCRERYLIPACADVSGFNS